MMQPDTKTPNINLNEDALFHLKQIFQYTKIITDLVEGKNQSQVNELLKGTISQQKDLSLQHALIFCFKAIGMHIDHATEILELAVKNTPLFWQELHFLRNALIHHCPTTLMPNSALELLASMSTKAGQVLKDTYPRDQRLNITQETYLKTVLSAITGLVFITANLSPLNEEGIKTLSNKDFYALQNLCELVATIMNPNPEYAVLTEKTIHTIRKQHPQAEEWLRSLGESRVDAMHLTGMIPSRALATHVKELYLLKTQVLLNPDFQDALGIKLVTLSPVPSTSTINTSSQGRGVNLTGTNTNNLLGRGRGTLFSPPPANIPVSPWGRGRGNTASQNTINTSNNSDNNAPSLIPPGSKGRGGPS